MKSTSAILVALSVVVICCRAADQPCSLPTQQELDCFNSRPSQDISDMQAHCKGVNITTLEKGDLKGSNICKAPTCIAALEKDIYTPCHRADLGDCLTEGCAKIGPSAVCRVATPEQMQCFQQAGAKFSDKLQVQCNGVDLDLLEKEEITQSKVCDHPECIGAVAKYIYTPCNRIDLEGCVSQFCHNNLTCAPVTDAQMKCMEDAGSKFSPDVQTQCKGVDFNALTNGNIQESHVCEHTECIGGLTKEVYLPCNRSDLGLCLRQACQGPLSNCTTVTPDEQKCMEDAGTKNGQDILQHCTGVDFDTLKKGDLKGSKLCEHPSCIGILDEDVYTPCKRHDIAGCIHAACGNYSKTATAMEHF